MEKKIYTSRLNQESHERDFLSTLIVMPWEMKRVTEELMIDESCFNSPMHQEIFKGIDGYVGAYGDDIYMVDISSLRQRIQGNNPNTFVTEIYLKELFTRGEQTRDTAKDPIRFYSEKLRFHNQKLAISQMAESLGEISLNPQINNATELYSESRQTFEKYIGTLETTETLFCNGIESKIQDMFLKMREGEDVHLQPIGIKALDKRVGGGFAPGSMVVIAARPGCGKTTLMLNIAENLIEDQSTQNRPVVFFSLEMTTERLIEKILNSYTEASSFDIRNRTNGNMLNKLESHLNKAFFRDGKSVNSLLISDKGALSLAQMRQQLKKIHNERGGITAVFIDYLQLMKAPGKFDSRNYELAEISRALREMSKEFETTFIVAAQLNRQIEANNKSMNGTETPKNSYLRDSGAIEQDADLIMFLTPDVIISESVKTVKLHITKNRFGAVTGENPIELQFNGATSLFSEPVKHALSGYYNRKGPSEYQGN